jgi:hypothetical protein
MLVTLPTWKADIKNIAVEISQLKELARSHLNKKNWSGGAHLSSQLHRRISLKPDPKN